MKINNNTSIMANLKPIRCSKEPKYKEEVIQFIVTHKQKSGGCPTQWHFALFIRENLCPKYNESYDKIYRYILKFCDTNHDPSTKKYFTRIPEYKLFDVL